ncbi:MAG TPA: transaldolase [Ktedonobacteraceae bacterium]|jgi:transaldolase|nr:transaldolase [Ktedonobacteraceae bacterium]
MTNPLLELKAQGQSVWYDNIDRAQLQNGQFKKLLDEDGIVGVTANPTIFQKSISHGNAYDEQMTELIKAGKNKNEIYEALVIRDIQTVADMLRPIYERTNGYDGYVSLEVSPDLAHDTDGTIAEVRRFWKMVNRPNLMIKIPATPEGIPAVQQALTEGINVNITLIFSIEVYRQVTEAYLSALEDRNAQGQDISHIASVASFFVSRVDTLVDKLLEDKIKATSDPAQQQQLKSLEGKAAIANARLVYQEFERIFGTPRFESLKHSGAHVQRPLWASTSTKNPAYRDVLYAEELIGPDTVDTMPLETIENFRDHGRVSRTVDKDVPQAKAELDALEKVGISYDAVTQQLLDEGVQKFADSFHELFKGIEEKRQSIEQQVTR